MFKQRYAFPELVVKLSPLLHPCWRPTSPLVTRRSSFTPACGQIHPFPPSGHLPPLFAVKFTRFRPAVILHPCLHQLHPSPPSGHPPPLLASTSPLSDQRSSSAPACGQTHPSRPSGHPPPLLAVKLTPLRPAVILHTCLRSNSPLSAQRSTSTPACGQTHPSPPSGHPPPLMAVKLTPLRPAIGERDKEGRQETGDGI